MQPSVAPMQKRSLLASLGFKSTARAWGLYGTQPVLPAALALALLYLTVMSMGLLMTAYLKCAPVS